MSTRYCHDVSDGTHGTAVLPLAVHNGCKLCQSDRSTFHSRLILRNGARAALFLRNGARAALQGGGKSSGVGKRGLRQETRVPWGDTAKGGKGGL